MARALSGCSCVEALWARMCAGTREDGSSIEPNDPHWDSLVTAALAARTDPRSWLAQSAIYGDLADAPAFAEPFADWLTMIWQNGTATALTAYAAR